MEQIIKNSCERYLILRVSNAVGRGGNPNLLMNYIVHSVKNNHTINVHTKATRNLIDTDDIKNITFDSPKTIVANDEVHRNLICIKSYGDYRFLELDEIAFLKADNNSTDITLNNGEVITAFKTLKYFEENLPSYFFRIHNSYIVNKNYVSRIHTGNTVCYIKNSKTQLPFSKSYKDNVEQIIAQLAGLEFKDI